ncbi:hypothetical protein scyTo_0016149 [Scyliorhinus torazame]|uniref:Uncharacterized protein n=1 Tax=Scyliorhinus torazame TaxID=75743 RepID=A0A401Q4J9_SCYTO|nr:hypothetical protein [Scyliorhinus torazame]
MKPIIVFILAAVQILHASGQSVDQAVSDAIDQINAESTLDSLVAVTSNEQTKVTLSNDGLQVTLKLNVKETICKKATEPFSSSCTVQPTNPIADTCTCMVTYDNCVLNNIRAALRAALRPATAHLLLPLRMNLKQQGGLSRLT